MLTQPTGSKVYPNKSYQTFALETALREIQAVQEGKVDASFLAYCERVIKRALAS